MVTLCYEKGRFLSILYLTLINIINVNNNKNKIINKNNKFNKYLLFISGKKKNMFPLVKEPEVLHRWLQSYSQLFLCLPHHKGGEKRPR